MTAPTWLLEVLAPHDERYDSDCGFYLGCACGWDNGTDEHNDGYDEHLAEVITAKLRERLVGMGEPAHKDARAFLAAVTDELLGGSDAVE